MTYLDMFDLDNNKPDFELSNSYGNDYRYLNRYILWLESKLTQSEERIKELESEIIVLREK